MFHVKRMAATALAALMVAGAVPALASADDASGTETPVTQEETVVESGRKAHKRRAQSVESGDAVDTDAASVRRKPSKGADADASESVEKPARRSKRSADSGERAEKPAKPSKKGADGEETSETSETVKPAKPSKKPERKPAKKSADGTETADAGADESVKRERPARKPAKSAEAAPEADAASSATLTI